MPAVAQPRPARPGGHFVAGSLRDLRSSPFAGRSAFGPLPASGSSLPGQSLLNQHKVALLTESRKDTQPSLCRWPLAPRTGRRSEAGCGRTGARRIQDGRRRPSEERAAIQPRLVLRSPRRLCEALAQANRRRRRGHPASLARTAAALTALFGAFSAFGGFSPVLPLPRFGCGSAALGFQIRDLYLGAPHLEL